jgi:hypothetical protein
MDRPGFFRETPPDVAFPWKSGWGWRETAVQRKRPPIAFATSGL